MIHMEELIPQFTGSGGLERQRGIDGEVAHLVQEYKDNLPPFYWLWRNCPGSSGN